MGVRIKKSRVIHGYTQEKLAELAEISTSFVGHVERGEKIPSIETLANLSRVLEESLDYIVFGLQFSNDSLYNDIQSILHKYREEK